jgi:hypothetical protein
MARLVLHIGAHLTGAAHLQGALFANRERLAQAGVFYPDIGPNQAHHALVAPWITLPGIPPAFFDRHGPDGLWARLCDDYAGRDGTVVLSAEAFSRAFPQRVDMADLARRTAAFADVRLVLTVRHQAELLPALWLELARGGQPPVIAPFMRRALRDHAAAGIWVDFGLLYDHLLTGFAPGQITVFDHARLCITPGGIAQAVLDLTGAGVETDLPPDDDGPPPEPLALYAADKISAPEAPDAGLLERIATAFAPAAAADPAALPRPHTSLLTRAEQAAVRATFAPLNAAFAARIRRVQPDFVFSEPVLPDAAATESASPGGTMFREDLTPAFWGGIAMALYRSGPAQQPPAAGGLTIAPARVQELWKRILGKSPT